MDEFEYVRRYRNNIKITDTLKLGLVVMVSRNDWVGAFEFPIEESFLTAEKMHKLLYGSPNEIQEISLHQWARHDESKKRNKK